MGAVDIEMMIDTLKLERLLKIFIRFLLFYLISATVMTFFEDYEEAVFMVAVDDMSDYKMFMKAWKESKRTL